MHASKRCRGAKASGAVWAVLLLGAATMLATSPPEVWHLTTVEQLSVVSDGQGDDVAVRIHVEIPPSIAVASHPEARTMSVGITSDRPASDVLVLFEREDDDFANPEEARFAEGDVTSINELFSILGGPCPEDVPCVDETIVILSAEEPTTIRYDFTVRVNVHGPDDDKGPAPSGEIVLTLEELDAVP